jgi:2-polyprenyl-3-methyl-5-hydroxy-6-metoxy-1,4-benzoquinol methylase
VYGCAACPIDAAAAPAGVPVAELQRALATRPAGAGRLAVLVGGEPLLRPDFARLAAVVRAAGWALGLITTGRPLVYPQVREKLRRAGLAYLRVQLFGVGEEHDRATALPGAFAQALAGVRAWMAETDGVGDVDVALSTRRRAPGELVSEIETLGRAIAIPEIQIVVAIDPAAHVAGSDDAAVGAALVSLTRWNEDASRPSLAWEGLRESPSAADCLTIPAPRPSFIGTTPTACCLGAVADLATAARGERRTKANSFNFIRTEIEVPWAAAADACTAHRGGTAATQRSLWLREGARLVLHVTDTGDFAAAAIARIKDEWSHLFLDRARAGVLDDFTEGMRRILPDPACETCAHRAACAHRFEVVDGPPFAYEEAWIAEYVGALRGRVLDVGCGEQLYLERLAPLVASGVVRYTGLDPDEPSVARLRAALPQARILLGGIEDFWAEPASYDRILCLRSLNHVYEVDEAVGRMAELLKPGGQLLIVETTDFAMVRRAEQVAAADRAPRAGHQHYRNVGSDDVLAYARRRGLQVVKHHPAGLRTTNEWILLLTRRG